MSGSFCVLGFEFPLGCSWCFLRLEIFIFSLGCLRCFGIFNVRVWNVSFLIGLGTLVRAFFSSLFSCPADPPRSVLGPGRFFFARVLAFFVRPADPPTQYWAMVWVVGPLN